MSDIKVVLMDLDGTVYRGNTLIDGASDLISKIREAGIRLFFFTNNSERSRASIALKIRSMGIDCEYSDIISSGYAAVQYSKSNGLERVYVSGSDEMISEFRSEGIDICSDSEAENLIICMDSKFDYVKLTKAVRAAIRSKKIIACNMEKTFPKEDGIYPGCSGMVEPILKCSDKAVDLVIGKPNTYMLEYVSSIENVGYGHIMVIGDTYESDIVMAEKIGAKSILVGQIQYDRIYDEIINQ